ncbi:M29 family metallopeptidase [Dongshaea marina]|uniref:leucyl aminopeptidase n=1 Tax=Dongshaea marina TaxID=2047966 RepID=UPI000D3E4608|nr:leucyl aminopeptidase [Dongshaea marina]
MKSQSIYNMYECLKNHPAISEKVKQGNNIRVLIGSDEENMQLSLAISESCHLKNISSVNVINLSLSPSDYVEEQIDSSDIYIFIYSSATLKKPMPKGPSFIVELKNVLSRTWKKSVIFKDYGVYFDTAFQEGPDTIRAINNDLICLSGAAKKLSYHDGYGGKITGTLDDEAKWTSIDGFGNPDVVPGEIATRIKDLSGEICFSGTFLSTVPFAIKYGVVDELMMLKVEASKVVDFHTNNHQFRDDFMKYLNHNQGNSIIEEFGIGTNIGIKELYGRNAGFEERHPGLHLGLGGGISGSHHLDLIFSRGSLSFDDSTFFKNGQFIYN